MAIACSIGLWDWGLGVELQVQRRAEEVVIQWPATATGFRIQVADHIPPIGVWLDLNATVEEEDGQFIVIEDAAGETRFFRLVKAGPGTAPVLVELSAPQELTIGGNAALTFSFPDIVSINWNVNPAALSVLMNDGTGGFPSPTDLPTQDEPDGFAVGDVDGDHRALNDGNGTQDIGVAPSPLRGSDQVFVLKQN